MSIFLWDSEPSKIFVWDTEVSAVYVWDTKVRPMLKTVYLDLMLVGWGWGWGWDCYVSQAWYVGWWGGWWGWVVLCNCLESTWTEFPITIGSWWAMNTNGWDSCFGDIIAYWWGWGWCCRCWLDWGSWWGGSWYRNCLWWACVDWQGQRGGKWSSTWSCAWGWGWYTCAWTCGDACGCWWCWYNACPYLWYNYWVASWWGWGQYCCTVAWICWGGRWGYYRRNYYCAAWTSATTCGSWGWWGAACCCYCNAGSWAWGMAVVKYPTDWSYGINSSTGWNCCYTCNWYCIHQFTSNWTFCITW